MTTLSHESRSLFSGSFHVNANVTVAAGSFAVAMILCLVHGDLAAIPALAALAAGFTFALGVRPPEAIA